MKTGITLACFGMVIFVVACLDIYCEEIARKKRVDANEPHLTAFQDTTEGWKMMGQQTGEYLQEHYLAGYGILSSLLALLTAFGAWKSQSNKKEAANEYESWRKRLNDVMDVNIDTRGKVTEKQKAIDLLNSTIKQKDMDIAMLKEASAIATEETKKYYAKLMQEQQDQYHKVAEDQKKSAIDDQRYFYQAYIMAVKFAFKLRDMQNAMPTRASDMTFQAMNEINLAQMELRARQESLQKASEIAKCAKFGISAKFEDFYKTLLLA